VGLIEIEKEIVMYKAYILASNAAIGDLNTARGEIDDGTQDLSTTTGNFTDGYKGGATSLAAGRISTCNDVATGRRESVTNTIVNLQRDIEEFNQKIQQLQAQRTAEINRLAEIARQVVLAKAAAAKKIADAAAKKIADAATAAAKMLE